MYDWEKELPKARERLEKENEERRKVEHEVNKRLMPYDFAVGIFLLLVLIGVVAVMQPSAPMCGSYEQVASNLRDAGYWVDATGNPPDRSDVLYQHYKSPTDEKVAVVDYRSGRDTCVVDCAEGQCDNIRPWLQTHQ